MKQDQVAESAARPQTASFPRGTEPDELVTFTDAAETVLLRFAGRKPMHYRVITDKIMGLGFVQTRSKTPEATLHAQINSEIRRSTQRGESPRFIKYGGGYFGLTHWQGSGLGHQIRKHNREVREALQRRLMEMDPIEFEALISRLLVALGFDEVTVTDYSGDKGIDVRGTLVVGDVVRTRMAIQVKRWKYNVQAPEVQKVRGSLSTHEQGLIITTSDFSRGARDEADQPGKTPVALMNGEQLVTLLVENDIGVTRTPYHLLELAEEDEEDEKEE